MDSGPVQIPLKEKYLRPRTAKRGGMVGNGDSGKHKKKKLTQKEKDAQNVTQRMRVMVVGPTGKTRMVDL